VRGSPPAVSNYFKHCPLPRSAKDTVIESEVFGHAVLRLVAAKCCKCTTNHIRIKFYSVNLPISTHYKDVKGDTKCQNGWFRVVRVTQAHWK